MSKMVVIDGDELIFNPVFGANTVTPLPPMRISGSGEACIGDNKICIVGDENKVYISATYIKGSYNAPGEGKLTIALLSADQRAEFATAEMPVIVVGSQFIAQFEPIIPATDPKGNPDPELITAKGWGKFINSQFFVMAG